MPTDDRFKYVDDLSILEIINLLSIGLTKYDFKNHVPSDIPTDAYFINNKNLKSQDYLNQINTWTQNQKMMINNKKTKAMIINFTKKHQFTTRLELNNKNIEVVPEMKILGTIISNSLSWNTNTSNLIQKVNKRMLLIKKILGFGASTEEMVHIWNMIC